jgi:nucleoside triphosphatase
MSKQQFPEPTVGALIFSPEDKLFLMKSHKWKGKYVIPGGHIELGETIEDALKREVKEETNLDIYDIEFVCFQEFIYDEKFWEKKHFIFFDYACRTDAVNAVLNHEAEEYLWVSLEQLADLPVESYTENAIREYLKRKHIPEC